ncbi:branched-chain amino acid ABC transporter permease [Albimonas pacifica]|uniref:Amino acid/amide ABC transporter membrane protein 2, HAAT family n=1 Tax=Albimonas pacifica TaxID=1114924 RepID=A0A1I3JNT1_9RHOB|nr:branched-chain amino acid ABC transporter permease [Albimonas pacifica]SFI61658.1 amino acid/amide ABC transporter membrane protein 2, HAAT family [Albimonas pacifica]
MSARDLLLPLIAVLVLAGLAFSGLSGTLLNLLIFMMIISLAAQGWNILGGFGGLSSFGHAAFFGTGAYTTLILQTSLGVNAWAGLVAGVLLGAAVGAGIGFLSFRSGLKGSYFALITLAFAEVLRIASNSAPITGGAAGILLPLDYGFLNLQFDDRRWFALIAILFVGAALALTRWLERSRFGAYLIAIRENEQAAQALGVDVFRVKLGAITLSAGCTALAGVLYAQNYLFVDAHVAYGPWISIEALFAAIVGGLGTMFGPLVGAVALLGLGEITKMVSGGVPGVDLLVFGAILILTVAFVPGGLMSLRQRLTGRRRPRGETALRSEEGA